MTQEFIAVSGGWISRLADQHREFIAELCDQVLIVLYWGGDQLEGDTGPEIGRMLHALLPDASDDVLTSIEVAAASRSELVATKMRRLSTVIRELRQPSGPGGAVMVRAGEEGSWLGALNDARLSQAVHLGIDGPQTAQTVHQVAQGRISFKRAAVRGITEPETAYFYELLTWWQESLLSVVLAGEGRA